MRCDLHVRPSTILISRNIKPAPTSIMPAFENQFSSASIFDEKDLKIPGEFERLFKSDGIASQSVAGTIASAYAAPASQLQDQRKTDETSLTALLGSTSTALATFRTKVGDLLESEGVNTDGRLFRGVFKKSNEFRAITSPIAWNESYNLMAACGGINDMKDAPVSQRVFWGYRESPTSPYHVAYLNGIHPGLHTFDPEGREMPDISVRSEQHGDANLPLVAPGSLLRFFASQFGGKEGRVYYGLKNASGGKTESLIIPFGNKFRTLLFKGARAQNRLQGDESFGITAVIQAMLVLGDVSLLGPLVSSTGKIGSAADVYKKLRGSRKVQRQTTTRRSKDGSKDVQNTTSYRFFVNKAAVEAAAEWQKSVESRLIGYAGLAQRMKNPGLEPVDGARGEVLSSMDKSRSESKEGNQFYSQTDGHHRPQFRAYPKVEKAGTRDNPEILQRDLWYCPAFNDGAGGRGKMRMSRTPVEFKVKSKNVFKKGKVGKGQKTELGYGEYQTKNKSYFICEPSGEMTVGSRQARRFLVEQQGDGTQLQSLAAALDDAIQQKRMFFNSTTAPRTFTRTDPDSGVTTEYIVKDQPALYELFNQQEQDAANAQRSEFSLSGDYKSMNQNLQIAFQALLSSQGFSMDVMGKGKERATEIARDNASEWLNANAEGGKGKRHPALDETLDVFPPPTGNPIPLKWVDDGFKYPVYMTGENKGNPKKWVAERAAKNASIQTRVLSADDARETYVQTLPEEGAFQARVVEQYKGKGDGAKMMHAGEPGFWQGGEFVATTRDTFNRDAFRG